MSETYDEPDDDVVATQQLELFETRLDALEEMLARLGVAYTEMAVVVENVVNTVMEPLDDAAKEKFHDVILKQQNEIREVLQGGLGRDVTPAPEHMVRHDPDSST